MIASVAGTLSGGRLIRMRPYRARHHSASLVSLVGGGLRVRPGEVSLALPPSGAAQLTPLAPPPRSLGGAGFGSKIPG